MQPPKRTFIGVASISHGEDGRPLGAAFEPATFKLDPKAVEQLLSFHATSSGEVITKAETVFSAWFVEVGNIETADREFNRIETEMQKCEKWASGTPKLCQVAFYLKTT